MGLMEQERIILKDLGNGLLLRRSTMADAQALAAFNARIHCDPERGTHDEPVAAWTRDLLRGDHPTFDPRDFTIVEEVATGRIISSLNLIPQTWTYGGVPFGVGRPELVGTEPEYRRRGLVRAQMEVVHGWSAERGHLVQAITGIPWYYRQFGYEMALNIGGGRMGFAPQVPKLKDGETEPYVIRPATRRDLPFVARLYEADARRMRVSCVRDAALWRYELERSADSVQRLVLHIIEDRARTRVGLVAHENGLWGTMLPLHCYTLEPGVPWLAVTPVVIRWLWAKGQEMAARDGRETEAFGFWLGQDHPAYAAAADRLPRQSRPYAWYVRVPDLPGFVRHVAPALERSLADSPGVGYSGELRLNFYRSGVRLVLERGRLTGVEPWDPLAEEEGNAGFPGLTFLQLVFGHRSIDELRQALPDCWVAGDEARVVLTGLFPKQGSNLWPIA